MNKILLFALVTLSVSCHPRVTIIPDSREIKELEGSPGYYIISGGHLKSLFEQQRILAQELEKCKFNSSHITK